MEALSRRRAPFVIAIVLILAMAVAACAPDPSAGILSPELGAQLVAQAADPGAELEPTPVPLGIADLSEEEITAGLPEDFAAALAPASAENGESVSLSYACIGCHSMDPDMPMTGPTWFNIGDTAVNRVPDQSPAFYLYTSIVKPNEHIVGDFPENVMLQNYGDMMSQEDIADLVSYLLAQHE